MKDNKSASLFQKEQVMESLKQSFVKLNPRVMIKNPIMFTVEVVTVVMLIVCFLSLGTSEYGAFGYNFLVFVILFVTLLFANFAEAIAEARGKAQADSLRKTREETPAKVLVDGKIHTVSSSRLKKGDYFICEAGDTIPADGEIVEGLVTVFLFPNEADLNSVRLGKVWPPLTKVPLPVNLLRLSVRPVVTRVP